ncbi:hypothetical protein J2S74_003075 [Evansella vedderi]|uniref:Uncharacterized protein n=1 Tax=Evansella vedderi TaxID=38282 RepID=A0ABT9ZWT0_9BACI|nr:hypothetical protein [Evansella vedderi]MDQ0255693.1 hypothetical protein [Evansella vedderi]
MKNFLKYFMWTMLIGIILYYGFKIELNLQEMARSTFRLFPLVVFGTLFPLFLGMILRLPQFINEIREKKRWKFNWAKFIAIGLPALYITIIPLFFFTSFGHSLPLTMEVAQVTNPSITTISGIISGYILLDCMKE